jgi:lipoprotein-anchoring transpeptidase ErfK/SrfK
MTQASRFLLPTIALVVAFFSYSSTVFAASTPDVRILDSEGNIVTVFTPYTDPKALIGSVAAADLGHDGTAEILIGSGEGNDPTVSVFRQDGSFLGSFVAYDLAYKGGVNVAACDVDGDGTNDIVTGAAWNGGPHVRIFTAMGTITNPGFFAFDSSFTGGVNIACGDVTGDGIGDIVVGAGLGGGPNVKVFSADGTLITEVFIDSATKNTGAAIALGDIDTDGVQEILTSSMGYATPSVIAWSFDAQTSSLIPSSSSTSSDTSSALIAPIGVVNGDIMIATQGYVEPALHTTSNATHIAPFSSDATHAIAAAPISESGVTKRFVVANVAPRMNENVAPKSILIDKSEQRLTAYEYGVPMHTFLVSTAKQGYYTPVGETTVRAKLLYHDYKWVFGIGDPRNYFVPGVKWNLRIYDHIYIHWAYWHNNFGNPMSHGCINMNAKNSEWIYEWSDVGTPVNIVE